MKTCVAFTLGIRSAFRDQFTDIIDTCLISSPTGGDDRTGNQCNLDFAFRAPATFNPFTAIIPDNSRVV
ncbi:hypothetical protein SAMN05444287_2688 [Octadecabacter temperatus]|jgi:hypothetical protein|uniref:Uncharacterized protein n=1 Tax=Octadecabacter temperatus TaxID=1458307 RepID=A0A0K0Y9R3_9RHOB|nr:hypothetical protein OSB_31420 [Octadecabacter temperatus]SIO40179.1 hypothetical protein SAMN05444287_2688 [Octadecabacter temperatus]